MARAAILLAIMAFFCVLANCAVGAAAGLGWTTVLLHFQVAIPTTIVALGAWTVVIFYFIGAYHWVVAEVEEAGASSALVSEARAVRQAAMPWVIAAVLALIVAYVMGGGAHSGAVSWVVHLGLALLTAVVHVVTVYRTIVLVGMMLDVQAKSGAPAGLPGLS